MKHRVVMAIAVLLCIGLAACAKKKATDRDNMEVADVCFEDSVCNWGTLGDSLLRSRVFWFRNTGTVAAVVLSVKPSCRCTRAEYTREAVRPGERGWVKVTFDGGESSPGYFEKNVVVRMNAPRSFTLRVRGTVPPPGD